MKFTSVLFAVYLIGFVCASSPGQTPVPWKIHDMSRPHPPIVIAPDQRLPVPPPSDAIVLFDGTNLSHWQGEDSGAAKWTVRDGYFESGAGSGDIHTRDRFGDFQLHLEWAAPLQVSGTGQGRGNSGVFLMGLYEIQILDSYHNDTYADGQAASVYGQYPPLSNVSRPPGEWQSYDIFFRRPRFDASGALLRPACVTLLHNGVLVQNNAELFGPTAWLQRSPYKTHPDRLPFSLQDHSCPVRFRNIWARDLEKLKEREGMPPSIPDHISLSPDVLARYAGTYVSKDGFTINITLDGRQGFIIIGSDRMLLEARSTREFDIAGLDGRLEFVLDEKGIPDGCTFHLTGEKILLSRKR